MAVKASLAEELRYRLDNFLARGSVALFIALIIGFAGSLAAITVVRFVNSLVAPVKGIFRRIWFAPAKDRMVTSSAGDSLAVLAEDDQ